MRGETRDTGRVFRQDSDHEGPFQGKKRAGQ